MLPQVRPADANLALKSPACGPYEMQNVVASLLANVNAKDLLGDIAANGWKSSLFYLDCPQECFDDAAVKPEYSAMEDKIKSVAAELEAKCDDQIVLQVERRVTLSRSVLACAQGDLQANVLAEQINDGTLPAHQSTPR